MEQRLYLNNDLWLKPPTEGGSGKAFIMAIAMHGLLFLLLYFGIKWQTQTPAAIEAELWSPIPQQEAPQSIEVRPETPIKKIVPREIKPIKPPEEKPDIALEQLRQRQQALLKKQQIQKEKLEREQLKQQQEKNRKKELERLGAAANVREGGQAQHSSGPSEEWAGIVAAAIRANIDYYVPTDLKNNPEAVFLIKLLPSGEMIGAPELLHSSGIPGYDEAVERAIRKTDPLPRPKNGIMERELKLKFHPLDKP